jgi:uncharacterized damage-inducible protein DinB
MTQNRPQASEYAPYYEKYVALVPDGEIVETLGLQSKEMKLLLGTLSEEGAEFRYSPGKWSIKEVLGHISDTERIFAYRLLRIARGDLTPLAGFEQDDYVKAGNFSARPLAKLLEEFTAVRQATIALVESLDEAAELRRGVASQKEISARALVFLIAGHQQHHRVVLQERYLPALRRD